MQFAPENIIQLLFAFQGLFFGILTLRCARLRPFALMLLTFAAHMVSNLLAETGRLPDALNFTSSFGFLYGPLLLLFVQELTSSESSLNRRSFMHALPFAFSLFLPTGSAFLQGAIVLSLLVYLSLTLRYVHRYRRALENTVTDTLHARADWLNGAAIAFVLLAGYDGARILSNSRVPFLSEQEQYLVTLMGAFLLINWLIVKTMQFPDLFWGLSEDEKQQSGDQVPDTSAEFTEEERAHIDSALHLFETEKLFLDPHLRLATFADQCGLDGRSLSQLIYRSTGLRFAAFVNKRRIDYATKAINQQGDSINFLKLAFDAGFNSKSAFNKAFKDFTGKTPSEYRTEMVQKTS